MEKKSIAPRTTYDRPTGHGPLPVGKNCFTGTSIDKVGW